MVPVALVNPAQPEYMSGEANVTVKGNQNPTIRLGLAQNGVNVIEFPAADSFFMVHPGNSELVSFDEETAKLSKRTLVLRPGAAFVAPPAGSTAKRPFGINQRSNAVGRCGDFFDLSGKRAIAERSSLRGDV